MRNMISRSSVILLLAVSVGIMLSAGCRRDNAGLDLTAEPRSVPNSVEGSQSKLKEVIIVFKTHFDIGFTDLPHNVVNDYRTSMIDRALKVCDKSRDLLPPGQRFVWTIPGWPMSQILWPGQDPERRKRVFDAFKAGQFVTHALAFTTHTESMEPEDLVRSMGFSSSLARSAGLELPRDAKMTDVPSHSWILPTLLKRAGVDFLHLGCNPTVASPNVPMLFWWEGPDGSRLLTMYSAKGYGSGLVPPKGWPYATWLALIHRIDNTGPPSPHTVKRLLGEAKYRMPGAKIRIGRLSDFGDAILKENPDLPVVRADMPDTWIFSIMSMPVETKIARNIRPNIVTLEALNTLLSSWGVDVAAVKETIAAAYEKSILYGEHTWGINTKLFGKQQYGQAWKDARAAGRYEKIEASWAEKSAYIKETQQLIAPAIEANMQALARAVDVDGGRIVVFNPLPQRRSGVVEVAVAGKAPSALKNVKTGELVRTEKRDGTIRFIASDVPPMGYCTYAYAEPAIDNSGSNLAVDRSARTIENAFFRIELDPARGAIASLVDKRTGRELVDSSDEFGFGQYLYERFSKKNINDYLKAYQKTRVKWFIENGGRADFPSDVNYTAATAQQMSMEIRSGDASVSAVMKSVPSDSIPHAVSLTVTLYSNQPFVDLKWSVVDKQADPWPEAGWLCLPFNVSEPAFRLSRLGSVIDPATDTVRSSNHDIYCLNGGMAVIEPNGSGAGLCPVDSPLVSLGYPGAYRYARQFSPRKPVVFVNLFNNIADTNFQEWIGGSWSSRVRLWAVDKYDAENSLITPSQQVRLPLQAAAFDGPAGTLPAWRSGVELSVKGVLVTAFGPNPDGDGLVLRLWEQAGRDGICRVRLPEGIGAEYVQPCDLRGRPVGSPIPVRDGRFDVSLTRFAPTSLLIDRKK